MSSQAKPKMDSRLARQRALPGTDLGLVLGAEQRRHLPAAADLGVTGDCRHRWRLHAGEREEEDSEKTK